MARIWKDKIFLACFVISVLAGSGLLFKLISTSMPQIKLNNTAPQVLPQVQNHSYTPVVTKSFDTTSYSRTGFMDKPMAAKPRPKGGSNEWKVGEGEAFDSHDLDTVILNAIAGDVISISPGSYDFSLKKAFKKIRLVGEDGPILKVKENDSYVPLSEDLELENVHVVFSQNAIGNSINLRNDIRFSIKGSTLESAKFQISLSDNVKLESNDTKFIGISINLRNASSVDLKNCEFQKAETFIKMSDFSSIKIEKSTFNTFSDSFLYNFSQHTSLKAYDIKVENGSQAFSGYNMASHEVSHSSFFKLESLTSSRIKINCIMCEMSEIQR